MKKAKMKTRFGSNPVAKNLHLNKKKVFKMKTIYDRKKLNDKHGDS